MGFGGARLARAAFCFLASTEADRLRDGFCLAREEDRCRLTLGEEHSLEALEVEEEEALT